MFQDRGRAKMESRSTAHDPSIKLSSCTICYTRCPATKIIALECYCYHCDSCLTLQFSNQLSQLDRRSRFGLTGNHPKCCGNPIPVEKVAHILPTALVKSIKSRDVEINSRDRTYCYGENCNMFIADHNIHNGQGFCEKCRKTTCVKCKAKWHFGHCNHGEDFEKVLALVENEQWRSCPNCHNAISKTHGCNFMV